MFKTLGKFKREYGATNMTLLITTFVSVACLLVGAIYVNIKESVTEVRTGLITVQGQTNVNTSDISGIRADLKWIKSSLENRGFMPKASYFASSTSQISQNENTN